MRDPELGEAVWNDYIAKASINPVYKKPIREGLYSDVAGALGAVHDVIWNAAYPRFVSRDIIKVIPTKNTLERFPKETVAYIFEGEGPVYDTGARVETQDVKADKEGSSKKEWTESFVEDASWDVLQWQIEAIGKALAKWETQKVIAAYKANEGSDAGTVDVAGNAVNWANVCDVIGLVEAQDFHPTVFVMHPKLFQDLMKLDQFVSSLYKDRENMRKGVVNHTTLDVTFISCSLCNFSPGGANATYGYCIDTDSAGVLLLRRDVTTKPYEDPSRNMYGVLASERIGVGILRPKAVARLRGTRS